MEKTRILLHESVTLDGYLAPRDDLTIVSTIKLFYIKISRVLSPSCVRWEDLKVIRYVGVGLVLVTQ